MAQVIKLDVIIPTRIEGNWKLTQKEQDCIVWSILSGCSLDKAYLAFVHPEMATSPKALKMYANQFASSVEVRNYISGYQERLNSFFSNLRGENKPTVKPATPTTAPLSAEERETRKKQAAQTLTDKVVEIISDVETLDDIDTAAKLADRVGVLEEKEQVVEKPRIYLPAMCESCEYKKAIEQGIKDGLVQVKKK